MVKTTRKPPYFALIASAIIVIAIAVAGYHFIVQQFDEESSRAARISTEVANDDMVEIIVNMLSPDIDALLKEAERNGAIVDWAAFAAAPAFENFDNRARKLALNTRILKIKVYNKAGLVLYSTDLKQLGNDYSKREEFVHALRGQSTSSILQRDFFKSFTQEIRDATLVASYHPLKSATGEIVGVAEVYANRTKEFRLFANSMRMHSVVLALGFAVVSILILSMLAYFAFVKPADHD